MRPQDCGPTPQNCGFQVLSQCFITGHCSASPSPELSRTSRCSFMPSCGQPFRMASTTPSVYLAAAESAPGLQSPADTSAPVTEGLADIIFLPSSILSTCRRWCHWHKMTALLKDQPATSTPVLVGLA
ncbi:hypothetical protein ILYODFUR_031706 [Ilyodon furcidens]|uniref:Uncharacterized protein n=1 Tax=Ilyodon furcidens TaxID=33524 RepID=A0ABV0UM76_9TELE